MKKNLHLALLLMLFTSGSSLFSQNNVRKVVFQSFWWNFKNNNFPNGWANYLAEMAPRLKSYGIDAVWIPPNIKNAFGPSSVGYAPYDDYDLGDKYQVGNVKTGMGNKDELLRMVAVLHANGIDVIQDVVGNQLIGAGDTVTNAGIDPAYNTFKNANASSASNDPYKLFRYSSYATPLSLGTINEYQNKQGRFPKNWENFHPNPADNCYTGDICTEYFGPDIDYADGANGQSSFSGIYDPNQLTYNPNNTGATTGTSGNGFMRRNTREWLVWYKKQLGFDGVRLDAAKNFDYPAAEDFLYNLQHASGFASGSDSMFAVGEIVGSTSDMDNWSTTVQNRSGTFDFNLRAYGSGGGIYSMISGGGGYDMQQVPGTQDAQSQRSISYSGINAQVNRTVPFVNSHDTQRPIVDATGNYTKPLGDVSGWDIGNELGGNGSNGGHIDPRDPRLATAYAIISAVDGNPIFYIEDLFDIGTTGKRYSHLPTSGTDLPVRGDLQNILQAQQKLDFKDGAYGVPSSITGSNAPYYQYGSSGDHLVIERSGKAVIGLSDAFASVSNNSQDQQVYVSVNSSLANQLLYDYSGAHGVTPTQVYADSRVLISTSPAGHTIAGANGHGYSIWAPYPGTPTSVNDLYNYIATYVPTRSKQTTQEWEMADDLGDSHCSSLGQGGQIPANSTHQRVAGKIFAAAGTNISYKISPQVDGLKVTASLWDNNGNKLIETGGVTTATAPLSNTYMATTDGWVTIKVRSSNASQAAQKCFVNVTYTAPAVLNTRIVANADSLNASIWTGNKNTADATDCGNWEQGNIPIATSNIIVPAYATPYPQITVNQSVHNVTIEQGAAITINSSVTLTVTGNWNNQNTSNINVCGTVQFAGSAFQQINGTNTFCNLQINNAANVSLNGNNVVSQQLVLTNGILVLNNNNLTIQPAATIVGGSASSYVQTANTPTGGGFLIETVASSTTIFPVGNSNYTPATLVNSGTPMALSVSNFENVLANGTSGAPVTASGKILKTWIVNPQTATGANVSMTLQWNTANSDGLNSSACFVSKNEGGAGQNWAAITTTNAANGSNPFTLTANNITVFSKFSVFSNSTILPVHMLSVAANQVGNNAVVSWIVNNQKNIGSYVIEKSVDGSNFSTISTQLLQLGTDIFSYQFTDHSFAQAAFYRVDAIDLDGSKKGSQQVFLRLDNAWNNHFLIAPNPVRSSFKILSNITSNAVISVTLITLDGKVLGQQNGTLDFINAALNTQMQNRAPGIYLIKITSADSNQLLRLIKQ